MLIKSSYYVLNKAHHILDIKIGSGKFVALVLLMLSTLEGVKYVLSALNLGLLNEAIFLSECIYLGSDEVFRLFYKNSMSLKGKRMAHGVDWTFEDLESALQTLVRLEKESGRSAVQKNVVEYIETLRNMEKIDNYLQSEEFIGQLLNLLTSIRAPSNN